MDEFKTYLTLIDDLWSKVTSLGSKYICKSEIVDNSWKIICLNLKDKGSYQVILRFPDLDKKRKSMTTDHYSWKDYFGNFKKSFESDNLFITVDTEFSQTLMINLWCNHKDKQLSYHFELNRTQDLFEEFLFDLIDRIKLIKEKQQQNQNQQPQQQISPSSMIYNQSQSITQKGIDSLIVNDPQRYLTIQLKEKQTQYNNNQQQGDTSSLLIMNNSNNNSPKQQLKRKAPLSLVNPTVKRRRAQLTKIGQDA